MDKKNIILNYTLDQYNKKYRNRRHRLLKLSKKQVEDFDKQYGHYVFNNKTHNLEFNYYLLKDRKWALIDDTYYEIPKPIRLTWFRNLNAGVQTASCLVGAVIVSSAIVFPTLAVTVWNKKEDDVTKITKKQFVDKANEYVTNFCSSTKEYSKEQLKCELNGEIKTLDLFEYRGSGTTRALYIRRPDTFEEAIASIQYSGDNLKNYLKEETETGVVYTINKDGEINYIDNNAGDSGFKAFSMNKYGYNTRFHLGTRNAKFIYTGEPDKEPAPTPVTEIRFEYVSGEQEFRWNAGTEVKAGSKFKAILEHDGEDKTNGMMFNHTWTTSLIPSLTDTNADIYITSVTYKSDGSKVTDATIKNNKLYYSNLFPGIERDIVVEFTVTKDQTNLIVFASHYAV